ncbi:tetratricopeptide repeat protein [Nisaea sp.]|uniref:adenylate/guanylate cyclase domain-containing protein n=1 Tax=Nisaea sp. TaxID=2024842 RepID=UPI0032EF5D26
MGAGESETSSHFGQLEALGRTRAAVLFIDVVGYSAMMEADENATHARWMGARRNIVAPALEDNKGRMVKSTGDGLLAIFASADRALKCAFDVHDGLSALRSNASPTMRIRASVNLVDYIAEKDDIYGGGVNIAARLLGFSDPGGTVVTASVEEAARSSIDFQKTDLGFLQLRNIERRIRAFKVVKSGQPLPSASGRQGYQPSIAVLPMKAIGLDEADAFIADSMVHEIVSLLSSLREVFVTSSATTLTLSGDQSDKLGIATQLGVQYLLMGRLMKSCGSFHVMVELSDTDRNVVIWSERFEFGTGSLFEVQQRIAREVSYALLPRIRQSEVQRFSGVPTEIFDAYGCMVRGMDHLYRLTPADSRQAKAFFERAIDLDPNFADAHAITAKWYILNVGESKSTDQAQDSRKALEHARRALEIDPTNATALALYGHTLAFLFGEFDRALGAFETALATSPNSVIAWGLSAPTYCYIGDGEEAIRRARNALALSPLEPFSFYYRSILTTAHYFNGDYEDAVSWGRRTYGNAPKLMPNLRSLAAALSANGEVEEAKRIGRKILELDPRFGVDAFLDWYPLQDPDRRAVFRTHLLAAGLPE